MLSVAGLRCSSAGALALFYYSNIGAGCFPYMILLCVFRYAVAVAPRSALFLTRNYLLSNEDWRQVVWYHVPSVGWVALHLARAILNGRKFLICARETCILESASLYLAIAGVVSRSVVRRSILDDGSLRGYMRFLK